MMQIAEDFLPLNYRYSVLEKDNAILFLILENFHIQDLGHKQF